MNPNINLKDNNGNTPLHLIVKNLGVYGKKDVLEIIQLLVNHGADPYILNNKNETPMSIAKFKSLQKGNKIRSIKALKIMNE